MKITIKEYIKKYINENLSEVNYDYCEDYSDILRIIAHYFNITKQEVYLKINEKRLTLKEQNNITDLLNKMILNNIPLQYITNKQYFFNEEYFVNQNVLIPRQDTEILVEKAIGYINKFKYTSLLDMCTGSGCIGISIANNSDIKDVTLVDISSEALEVTKKNIIINKVKKNIKVVKSDLFTTLENKKYDIIVSNPPYIKRGDMCSLEANVLNEPHLALDGGEDGLDIYRKILIQAKCFLHIDSVLLFEIGYDQLEDIKKLVNEYKEYDIIECVKDLANNDRVVVCKFIG